jgi:hypothetical protein
MSKISATNRFETPLNPPMDWHEAGHQMRRKIVKKSKISKKKTSISVKYTCIFFKFSMEYTCTFSMGAKRFIFG